MSTLIIRRAIVPMWLGVVIGVFALFGLPMTFAKGWLLLFMGVVPPAIMVVLSKKPHPTVAEVLRDCDNG